jgi:GH24 family phage-related lysozyme (muramidase)
VKKASDKCIQLIKRFEGFSAKPYLCPAGVATIGYGSTRDTDGKPITMAHKPITETEANNLMRATLVTYENAVNRYVKVEINQNQFDALVDFAYNAGAKNLLTSTLLKKLNAGDYTGASKEFSKWVYAGSKKLNGLVRRREAERQLFIS